MSKEREKSAQELINRLTLLSIFLISCSCGFYRHSLRNWELSQKLILLIRNGRDNADGIRIVPLDYVNGKFSSGKFFFMNASPGY